MNLFRVIKPGLFTTIQDLGRFGYQKDGIVVGGAMDQFAVQIGNSLLGNKANTAVIEITMLGPELEILNDCIICITGADLSVTIDSEPVKMWKSIHVKKNQVISFGTRKSGMRAYLCVQNGINVNELLGSRSTYTRGNFGGFQGRSLQVDDVLEGIDLALKTEFLNLSVSEEFIPKYDINKQIRVVVGPEFDSFTDESIKDFFNSSFIIGNSSDRMGYKLEGTTLKHKKKADIVSDAINIGTIQVPKDGQPIILMSDRQTTGGYTRIGNVISCDLPLIAQRIPGQKITFEKISVETSQKILREQASLSLQRNFYVKY